MKKGWESHKLGDISNISYGYTAKSSMKKNLYRYLRITDIQNNCVNWDSVPFCDCEKDDIKKYQLKKGDIVFARTGATTGKSYLLKGTFPSSLFASYLIRLQLTNKNKFSPDFIRYYFETTEYWKIINTGIVGAAQGGFNAKKLSELNISIPPLSEQQRIVTILDNAFAKIETIKQNAERNLQNAKELFQRVLHNTLLINNDWEMDKLSNCFKLTSGDYLSSKMMNNGEYPVYGGNGITGMHNKNNVSGENIIIGRVGALCGNARYIDNKIWLTDNGFKLTNFKYNFDLPFLAYQLNFIGLRNYARQAAQPVISNSSLKDIPIIIPPLSVQQQIVTKLDALSEKCKALEHNYQQIIQNCDELKQSILTKAFNGAL